MKYLKRIILILLMSVINFSCEEQDKEVLFLADNPNFKYSGRVDKVTSEASILIGAASSIKARVKGDAVTVFLKGVSTYNYVTIVADGENLGRFKIDTLSNNKLNIQFKKPQEIHDLEIVKATEASSGGIIFKGIEAKGIEAVEENHTRKKIEFIGDSITCGAAMDDSLKPCGEGEYIDFHNAYLSYGPQVARALNTDYMLSSISGWGIYRGWNTEESEKHAVSEVYDNTYLNDEGSKPWDFSSYVPDVVSICLGTNDLSKGDGIKERLPFNEDVYVAKYIQFINKIYGYYPNVKIGLLTSPMVSGKENEQLVSCLQKVQAHFKDKSIPLFQYDKLYVNGCSYHPSVQDHKEMAEALTSFYLQLLN